MNGTQNRSAGQCFRALKRCPDPRVRVICFPHAGGAASFFRPWVDLTPDGVELIAIRYPGREDRILDPPAEAMEQLADPIAEACSALLDAPLALFGHSMGASVAFEVALRLKEKYSADLAGLFVSACAGPGRDRDRSLANAPDEELIEDLIQQGGTDARTFADPELRELILPLVRADYGLLDRYQAPTDHKPLDTPVVAYYGEQEEDLDRDSVAAWSSVTSSTFTMRAFDGGHFYLVEHRRDLLAQLFASV